MGSQDSFTPGPPAEPRPYAGEPTRVRYFVLGGLCLLALLTYVQRLGFASTGRGLKNDLGLTTDEWSQVMTAFLVAYALFEVPWGILGDRTGTRHLFVVLVLGWSLMTAALALMKGSPGGVWPFYLLLGLRFLFGLFQAGGFPAISRALTDWIPITERATAQGLIWTLSRAGGAVAPFVMVPGDWPMSFVLLGSLGVVWCVAFWPLFRDRPEEMPAVNAAERAVIAAGRTPGASRHGHLPLGQMLGSRSVWALCFMYGFGAFSGNLFVTMLPTYLSEERGFSDGRVRWMSGLPLGCGVVGCLLGGVISDMIIRRTGNRRWGRRVCGMFGQACAGASILATIWVEDYRLLAALLAATFFFNDLAMGPAWASVADIGERVAGTLGGTMNMIGNLGGAIGTRITGLLLGQALVLGLPSIGLLPVKGNELLFYIYACSWWLGSLCWLGVDVTRPLEVRDRHAPAAP